MLTVVKEGVRRIVGVHFWTAFKKIQELIELATQQKETDGKYFAHAGREPRHTAHYGTAFDQGSRAMKKGFNPNARRTAHYVGGLIGEGTASA